MDTVRAVQGNGNLYTGQDFRQAMEMARQFTGALRRGHRVDLEGLGDLVTELEGQVSAMQNAGHSIVRVGLVRVSLPALESRLVELRGAIEVAEMQMDLLPDVRIRKLK